MHLEIESRLMNLYLPAEKNAHLKMDASVSLGKKILADWPGLVGLT